MNESATQKAADQKAVTLEAMAAVAPLLATKVELKAEVKKQIEELPQDGATFEFATTEEVLALFQEPEQGTDDETVSE